MRSAEWGEVTAEDGEGRGGKARERGGGMEAKGVMARKLVVLVLGIEYSVLSTRFSGANRPNQVGRAMSAVGRLVLRRRRSSS